MKKVKLVVLLLLGVVSFSFAQGKKKSLLTVTISTPGIQCEACKNILEQYMTHEEGVTKAVADFKRKITKVTYWTDRTNPENIKTAIANVGFDADDVTANLEFAKKLPPCCKKT
ncbi:MAG: heavy-metal-associated domain-containing protein [Chitinophagaceae bacterium]